MSTYNGERYIEEQIESIFNQTISDQIKLFIRDDGSTDSTLQIIERLQKDYKIDLIKGENIGVNQSVRFLLERRDKSCELFALADQDDVWDRMKLQRAYSFYQGESAPFLYGSVSEIVDGDLNHIGYSMTPRKGVSYKNALIQNVIAGHTQVINNSMAEELLRCEYENILILDWWIYIVASSIGKIYFDEHAMVKYRQHGRNQIGYERNKFKLWIGRLKRIKEIDHSIVIKQMELLLSTYGDELRTEEKEEIEKLLNCSSHVYTRLWYIFHTKLYRTSWIETLAFKIMYLGNYYGEKKKNMCAS